MTLTPGDWLAASVSKARQPLATAKPEAQLTGLTGNSPDTDHDARPDCWLALEAL